MLDPVLAEQQLVGMHRRQLNSRLLSVKMAATATPSTSPARQAGPHTGHEWFGLTHSIDKLRPLDRQSGLTVPLVVTLLSASVESSGPAGDLSGWITGAVARSRVGCSNSSGGRSLKALWRRTALWSRRQVSIVWRAWPRLT